ncbi:glycoside hydrolase family 1 protein [Heyndrickxia sporothermodurans]
MENNIKFRFPEGFWWGSASSATQMEGAANRDGKGRSIWDYWYETEPNRFFDLIGPNETSNFYELYKEDIRLMKKLGHNSFRFSISWSRLIPGGQGEINVKAVDFYNRVINELLLNEIEPFLNLYHFDMPLELQEKGGWESREVVEAYVNYAKTCFDLFGDRVKKWFTHNEPIVPVENQYLYGHHYPALCDFQKCVQAGFHSILASAMAIKEYHEKNMDGKIGTILNLTPSYPRSTHPADVKASIIADAIFNRSFLDPSVKGTFPHELVEIIKEEGFMPIMADGDLEVIKENTVDLLGINYYQPRRVKAKENLFNPHAPFMPERYFDYHDMPGKRVNPYRGWEIYEKGIYDLLINVKEEYRNIECFIAENGMGVENEQRFINEEGIIEDDYRIHFYQDHLKWVYKAIEDGVNVKGYHVWTFVDNWSWLNAYKNRYGLVSVDIHQKFKRTIKKSGYWFKDLTKNNGF